MPFYRCSIRQGDGTMVAENLMVSIEETPEDEESAWYGTITATHLTNLRAGQRYRLLLPDGRSGEFVVRRNTFAGGENRAVAIHGFTALK